MAWRATPSSPSTSEAWSRRSRQGCCQSGVRCRRTATNSAGEERERTGERDQFCSGEKDHDLLNERLGQRISSLNQGFCC